MTDPTWLPGGAALKIDDPGLERLTRLFAIVAPDATTVSVVVERDATADGLRTREGTAALWGSDRARFGITTRADVPTAMWVAVPVVLDAAIALPGVVVDELWMLLSSTVPDERWVVGGKPMLPMARHLVGIVGIAGKRMLVRFDALGSTLSAAVDFDGALTPVERAAIGHDLPDLGGLGFDHLAELFGLAHSPDDDLQWLPEQLRDRRILTLDELHLAIDPTARGVLTKLGATVSTGELGWPLVPGFGALTVTGLRARFDVDNPLDPASRLPRVTVAGRLTLGRVAVDLAARWPDLAITGSLAAPIALADLLAAVHLPVPVAGPELSELVVQVAPSADPVTFALYARATDLLRVPLGAGSLDLADLALTVALTRDRSLDLDVRATLAVGRHELVVSATADHGGAGWSLRADLGGPPVDLTDLLDWVAERFGAQPLPQGLLGASVSRLSVAVDTATQDVRLGIGTELHLELGRTVQGELDLDVELARHPGAGYTAEVSGRFAVAGHAFDLVAAHDSANVLVGAYRHEGHVTVGALLADLVGTDELPIPIDVTDAVVARVDGATMAFVDIGAGFDLSALPVVGRMLPADEKVEMDLRVLGVSTGWTRERVAALAAHLPAGHRAPEPPPEGQELENTLVVALRLGGETHHLPLGLEVAPKPENGTATALPVRHDGSAAGEAVHWIPVQRSFGPVHLSRVGARHADGEIELLLDGDVSLGGITLALAGLALRTPLETFRPEVDLAGLGLDVRQPGFELAGEFLRLGHGFAGGALLRTDAFSLSAVGAYEQLPNGQASLFVYAVLDYPLGGPAFFFVTGLAAGFGYNRAVVVPPVAKVTEFPLVKEASSGASAPPASGLTAKLQSFSDALPPSAGSVFGALGITFTSFKTVDSFALLVVSFGSRLRFDLLGSSTLIAPAVVPGAAPVPPVAEIHMGFHAQLVPEEGFLGLEAQLTAASYVLSDRCHLTGGAAFFSWLAGEHAGDFVVSVGGYHPHFPRPDHYPVVPRVGVDWHVTDELAIKGDLYYALTGHAIMAGGHLEASYTSASVTASFAAGIDLLACWQPLRYEGLAYVHVAVHWGPFDFEVGADVHVWGPPFAGYADVDLHITTVRVHFGDVAAIEPTAATWADFAEAALPGEKLSITCSRGLVAEIGTRAWVVDPDELVLAVGSRIPLTRATVGGTVVDAPGALRVAPMGAAAGPLDAPLTVTVGEVDLGLRATPVLRTGPAALWGAPRSRPDPADHTHVDTLAGLELRPPLRPPASETAALLPERFEPVGGRREPGYTRLLAGTDLDELSAEDVRAKRERVFAALGIDPAELRPAAGTPATPRRIMVWPLWRDS